MTSTAGGPGYRALLADDMTEEELRMTAADARDARRHAMWAGRIAAVEAGWPDEDEGGEGDAEAWAMGR